MKDEEYYEQVCVADYLRKKYPKVLFTASASGVFGCGMPNYAKMLLAKKLVASGYRKGCCDLLILEPKTEIINSSGLLPCMRKVINCAGLLIEMKKKKGGTVSPEQKEFLRIAEEKGYKAIVCEGADKAILEIDIYLNGSAC